MDKTTKVKSYTRNGKLVKSHNRVYSKKQVQKKETSLKKPVKSDKGLNNLVKANLGYVGLTGFALTRKNKIFRNTILISTLLGRPVSNYLILKARYEDKLQESGKKIKEGNSTEKVKLSKNSPKPYKTDKPQLTFFLAGLSDNQKQVTGAYNLMKKTFANEGFLEKTELINGPQTEITQGRVKGFLSVVGINLSRGRNPDAEKLAKYIYDWKKVNPDAKINLIGHSGGGLTSKDVAYILRYSGVNKSDLKIMTLGSPYVDIVPTMNPIKNIIIKEELFNKITPIKTKSLNEINITSPKKLSWQERYELHRIKTYMSPKTKSFTGKQKHNPVYDTVVDNMKQFFGL